MGAIADAKACYIEVEQGVALIKMNAGVPSIPISATSGFWIWFNPSGGLTALTVSTTANAKLRVYMFT